MRVNSGPLARVGHFRLIESLFLHSGLDNIAVDQTHDVGVMALPLSLIHAASLAVDSPIEQEQSMKIVPGHHVATAAAAIEKLHAAPLDGREWVDLLGAQYLARVAEAGGDVLVGDIRIVAKHIRLRPAITQQSHNELDRQTSPSNDRLPNQDGRVDGDSVRRGHFD